MLLVKPLIGAGLWLARAGNAPLPLDGGSATVTADRVAETRAEGVGVTCEIIAMNSLLVGGPSSSGHATGARRIAESPLRFRRCKSRRRSAALWYLSSASFSSAFA